MVKDLKWKVLEHIHGGDFGSDVNERSLAVYAAQEKLREMNNEELLDAIGEVFEKEHFSQTFWNGEPCEARIVEVTVGKSPVPTWWCAKLEGTQRQAVEVTYRGQTFFLDNEGGLGWRKVTVGRGSPHLFHAELPVAGRE